MEERQRNFYGEHVEEHFSRNRRHIEASKQTRRCHIDSKRHGNTEEQTTRVTHNPNKEQQVIASLIIRLMN